MALRLRLWRDTAHARHDAAARARHVMRMRQAGGGGGAVVGAGMTPAQLALLLATARAVARVVGVTDTQAINRALADVVAEQTRERAAWDAEATEAAR